MKEKLKKDFDELKKAIVVRTSSRLEEPVLKAVITSLEEFDYQLDKIIDGQDYKLAQEKEENNILRSIAGVTEDGLHAKIVEKNEEARFLREQLLKLKKEFDKVNALNGELKLEIEQLKNENKKIQAAREAEQKKCSEELTALSGTLSEVKKKIASQDTEISSEMGKLHREKAEFETGFELETDKKIMNEIKLMGGKLRNLCGPISGSAKFCLEKLDNIRNTAPKVTGKSIKDKLSGKPGKSANDHILELAPDLDLMERNSLEMTQVLDMYLKLYDEPKVNLERINFGELWKELNGKYMAQIAKMGAKIKWPNEKAYPVFITDRKLLTDICTVLLSNSLESIAAGGSIEFKGSFSQSKLELSVTDNGMGVKPADRSKLFTPFFSTKPGRWGMGLATALRTVKHLRGTLAYAPAVTESGSVFTLVLPASSGGEPQ